MRFSLLRRSGFIATIATGTALLGAGIGGVAKLDSSLKLATATPNGSQTAFVEDRRVPPRDCGGAGADGRGVDRGGERDFEPVSDRRKPPRRLRVHL